MGVGVGVPNTIYRGEMSAASVRACVRPCVGVGVPLWRALWSGRRSKYQGLVDGWGRLEAIQGGLASSAVCDVE